MRERKSDGNFLPPQQFSMCRCRPLEMLLPRQKNFAFARATAKAGGAMVSVYLFVPNLIGYARVILALVGYTMAMHHHQVTLFCYMGSQFLDALDGLAARMLGQSSEFGVPPLSHAAYAAHTPADVAAAA